MKKKKLLVTASTFPRWEGDTEPRFVLDLSKQLKKYFDVTVLAPAAPGAREKEILEGVKVLRYHYFPVHKWETLCYPGAIVPRIKEKKIRVLLVPFLFAGLFFKLLRIKSHFDCVHAHWIIPQGIVQSFVGMPYIVTGHGGDVTSLNKGIIKKLKLRCLMKADKITVVSNALKKEVEALCHRNDVKIISMGCDTTRFDKKYRVENYFHQGEKPVVLFVGRLAEKKGVTYLIEAMKYIDAKLIIVGDGPLKNDLMQQAVPQKDKICFMGSRTHQELIEIYASADVFVAPSITAADGDKEGLGLVLLEAMASGLPVIGSNSGGIPEIVHDGKNGFLTREKDSKAIAQKVNVLLTNREEYEKMSENAVLTAKEYDYKVLGKKYSRLIKEVLNEN
ncbi:MAG: glycosyltransferase family 4 protein [Catenibacillus sp.]|nr:glycosyltransferase family 4 protein [Catenibacillus sp.]